MEKIVSKATTAILPEYQCDSQILIAYSTIVWGLISENKGYSPRRDFILAFIPPVQQKGHLQHMLLLQLGFCTKLKVFPFFCFNCSNLYGKILIS